MKIQDHLDALCYALKAKERAYIKEDSELINDVYNYQKSLKDKKLKRKWRNPKQKIIAILMVLVGIGSTFIDGDVTACVFLCAIAIGMFFSKNNWMEV